MSKFHSSFVSFGRVQVSDIFKSKLFKYAIDGRVKKVDNLLSSQKDDSYDIDAQNTRGQTALFAACMLGHYKVVSLLLQLGANPNRRSDDGSTPTHAAAFSCNVNVIQIICEYGGDLRFHDDRDLLPRDWAVEAGPKRNKKILEQIDCWQNQVLSHIEGHKNNNHKKSSTSSATKLWKFNTSESVGNTSSIADYHNTTNNKPTQQHSTNSAFGNFSSFNGQRCVTEQFGFSALIPIIGVDQLSEAHNEENITYQTPPHFLLTNGYWGNQAITRKKIRESKRRILRHMASTRDLMMREVQFLGYIRHANILTLLSTCVGKCTSDKNGESPTAELSSPHTLIFEQILCGSLYGLLHEKNNSTTNITSLLRYLQQISNALEFIHQRGYIHCCVTSHSVHIVNLHTAKLSDFYYSVHIDDMNGIGTPISSAFNRWLAPELLADKKPTIKCDVYSYGVVLCEAMSGTLPWRSYDVESIRHQVVTKGKKFPLPESKLPVDLLPVLRESLEISRRKRNIKLQEVSFFIKKIIANYSRCLEETPNLDRRGKISDRKIQENRMTSTILSPDDVDDDVGVDVVDAVPCYNPPPSNNAELRRNNFNEKSSSLDQRRQFGSYKTPATNKIKKRYSLPPDHALETAATIQSFSYCKDTEKLHHQQGGEFPMRHDKSISPVVNPQNHCKPGDGDHIGDESAGLVHPVLMDSDSFDSSLAESYGYQRRNSDQDIFEEEIHNTNRTTPPSAPHEYDDDVIIRHVSTTNAAAQQRHLAVRSKKSPTSNTGNVEISLPALSPRRENVEISLPALSPRRENVEISPTDHNNRTYEIIEEDEVRKYTQQETQTEETNEMYAPSTLSSEGKWRTTSLNRCGGFRNSKKKPIYMRRNKRREPPKMASLNMRRKTVKKANRSASDPLRNQQTNEEIEKEILQVVPEYISEQQIDEEKNDESVEIQETVDRVHNSLVELSRMLTSTTPPVTNHHDVTQSYDHHGDVTQSYDHHGDVTQSYDHHGDVTQSYDHHGDVTQSYDHQDDVRQSRDHRDYVIQSCGHRDDVMQPRDHRDDVIAPTRSTEACNSSQLKIIREPIITPTTTTTQGHVIDTDPFDDVIILTCGDDEVTTSSSSEEEERPQVVKKEQHKVVGVESLSSFAIEVIDACSNYFPNAMQHYRKQHKSPTPIVVTSSSAEECGSDDDDNLMTSHEDGDSRKRRRFSLESSDLEDLYSKFADRKSFYRDDDDVTKPCNDDVTHQRDDGEDSDDDSSSPAPPCGGSQSDDDKSYSGGKSPSQMFDVDDDGDVTPSIPRVDEVDDVTGRDVTVTLRRVNSCIEAQAPPQLEDFIDSTTFTAANHNRKKNVATINVWRSKSECTLPKKSKKIQVGPSWSSLTSTQQSPHEKLFPYLSMTKPGSHGVCLTRNKPAVTSSAGDVIVPAAPPHTPKSVVVEGDDYQLNVTPSKWSFKMKREVFEVTDQQQLVMDEKKCDVTTTGGVVANVMTTPVNPPHLISLLRHEEKGVKTSTPLDRHHKNLLTSATRSGGLPDESCFPYGSEQISDIQKCCVEDSNMATSNGGSDEIAATRGCSDENFSGISYDDSEVKEDYEENEIEQKNVDDNQRVVDEKNFIQDQRSVVEDRKSSDEDERSLKEERSFEEDESLDEDERSLGEDERSSGDERSLEDERSCEEDEARQGDSTSIWVESNEEEDEQQQEKMEEDEISDDED